MRNKNKIYYRVVMSFFLFTLFFAPEFGLADTLSSPNYNLLNPQFSVGAGSASSSNYTAVSAAGGQLGNGNSASTNYKGFWGFFTDSYPGVPGTPTLTNTGGVLYSSLDFVINTGGNTTDTNYAIAISPDNFVTTYYIQAGDTLGATAAWQSYTAWGASSGQRVTGLAGNTAYTIKVKARFGVNTETGFSSTASATTYAPQLSFSISGVSAGTFVASQTTTIGTSSNAMSFSTLPVGSAVIAAQTLTTSTNASGGYTTTLYQDGNLRKTSGDQIQPVPASNAAPAPWPTSITTGEFGYHSTDANLCTGTVTRFSMDDTYAAATSTPTEVACNAGAVTSETTSIVYKLQIGTLQQAGTYSNVITYITTAVY